MDQHLNVKHMDQATKCFTDSQRAREQKTSKEALKLHSQTGYVSFSLKAIVCSANSENIPVDTQRQHGNWNSHFLYISKKF